MSKSLADVRDEAQKKYNTSGNTHDMFPIGTKVKIITPCQDFNFFYGETGVVTKNTGDYLGIRVTFDEPRHFKDGSIQESFNFDPDDLYITNDWNPEENEH
jgi:hypothetical protein